MTKSRNINRPRHLWTDAEIEMLRCNYADSQTGDLAAALGLPIAMVYAKANRMGLLKSEAFAASDKSGRIVRGGTLGQAWQFKPGQNSWSKGLKGVVGVQPECRATQFRPGERPLNWLPVGSLRINSEGYLDRKVNDLPGPQNVRWKPVHRLIWIEANGVVPQGHVVVFRPGQRTTVVAEITLDRLDLVTKQELMRRNSVHTVYPPEVARLVQLNGALKRQINKRARDEQNAE